MLRDGWKTLEFWSVIILAVLGVLKQAAYPDIPDQAFYTVLLWILTRAGLKTATAYQANKAGGIAAPSIEPNPKLAIKSSEGLLSAIAAPLLGVASTVAPIPAAIFQGIMAYTLGRAGVKMFAKQK